MFDPENLNALTGGGIVAIVIVLIAYLIAGVRFGTRLEEGLKGVKEVLTTVVAGQDETNGKVHDNATNIARIKTKLEMGD